jgi:FKBP-type peptidyl-prolyl cis-trans isomerase
MLHYHAWTPDGRVLDSTARRAEPSRFAVDTLPPGVIEVLESMTVGEARVLWVPASSGVADSAGEPPTDCIYFIHLLAIE